MAVIANVRGTADVLPAELALHEQIADRLSRNIEAFGYKRIDVPVIEHTELFLAKSGEDIISKTYSFSFKKRNICLRPEFTASVGRAFVNHLQDSPLPLRLYYAGPVFRYEKPQKGRYRQFNQIGVELVGAQSPWADAEIISCACSGLDKLGITGYRVVIGHIGVVTEILRSFQLDRRAQMFLLQNMENLSKEGRGIGYVRKRLQEVYPGPGPAIEWPPAAEDVPASDLDMQKPFAEMSEEEARIFLHGFLAHMEINVGLGSREPEDIVERLLRKLRDMDASTRILWAIELLNQLNQLAGPPDEAIPAIRELFTANRIETAPLAELERLVEVLDLYEVGRDRIVINLGMGRGLQYYTGMIFEIYHQTVSSDNQICGGGRYDDLIKALGGSRDVPACGFSYGLERVRLALDEQEGIPKGAEILVIGVTPYDRPETIKLARELRELGLRVETDVRERGVKGNLQYADRAAIPFAIILGSRERESGTVALRDMARQEEHMLPRDQLALIVEQVKGCARNDG